MWRNAHVDTRTPHCCKLGIIKHADSQSKLGECEWSFSCPLPLYPLYGLEGSGVGLDAVAETRIRTSFRNRTPCIQLIRRFSDPFWPEISPRNFQWPCKSLLVLVARTLKLVSNPTWGMDIRQQFLCVCVFLPWSDLRCHEITNWLTVSEVHT